MAVWNVALLLFRYAVDSYFCTVASILLWVLLLSSLLLFNLLTPNVNYSGRTAPLTSKVAFHIFFQQIKVLNILNMVYNLRFFPLENAVCFIILTYFVSVLFTFYTQGVLKL